MIGVGDPPGTNWFRDNRPGPNVPGTRDRNSFFNQHTEGQAAPYNIPGGQPDDRVMPVADNPGEMFSPQQNLARNQTFAKPGPYVTPLTPQEQVQFNGWLQTGQQGGPVNWNPRDLSYDMPGFWRAMRAGDPEAKGTLVPQDKDRHGRPRYHYPDKWKTPYEATFSQGSIYAKPNAPQWVQMGKDHWQYRLGSHVIFDDNEKRWRGMPNADPKQ